MSHAKNLNQDHRIPCALFGFDLENEYEYKDRFQVTISRMT